MSKEREWGIRRLPPKSKTVSTLENLTTKELVERCWIAEMNDECSMEMASEAWARVAELVDMLEGKRPIDLDLLGRLNEHRAHVIKCRTGSCEHEFAVLMRDGLIPAEETP